ncbi:hypothetical protein DLD77_04530 [Chitinophaga alhagiae]|uniref:DUF4199 domain-containing protein n=1 Tax=Chitinophaga alhagiae TaxID=2203219 RepID=A0ABN5LPF1_9BACT|nr:hypothetical protein [Chitinophaga alhagiae]AWO01014.1 hypothetical protein DLD77_04530 [Chitinophaga alhagiae]
MAFSFGLFRFLTYGNLVVVGFFMLFVAMAMIVAPSMSSVLISLLVLGAVLYHNILCLRLQRSLIRPTIPLPRNFPTLLMVISVLSFIYAMLVFRNVMFLMGISDNEFMKMVNQNSLGGQQPPLELVNAIRRFVTVLAFIHGLAIAANCVLSSVFLNRWKKLYADNTDIDSFPEE